MPLKMEYNTERNIMAIPEYGRHVHKLIDHCKTLEDREERNRMARAIIDVMGNLQPHLRDVADFKHKLWDQLFFMADFALDVDSPYPIPTTETIKGKPKTLAYPKLSGDMREMLTYAIANHMKKCYLLWNKDTVSDDIINNHLIELSNNQLSIDAENHPLTDSQILTRIQDGTMGKVKPKKKK